MYMNNIDLTVIIVNYNTKQLLDICIESVIKNYDNINYEIIVVDNASMDGSVQLVNNKYKFVHLIKNKSNIGFAQANNQASIRANGRYILALNSDTIIINNEFIKVIHYMDKHDDVGIATGKILNYDKSFQCPYHKFPGFIGTIFNQTLFRVYNFNSLLSGKTREKKLSQDQIHKVDWVTGAYLIIRTTLLDEGRIFDKNIFMYYEDTLLCKRIHMLGYNVVYLPYAPIIHYHGGSAHKTRSKSIYFSFLGSQRYIEKIHGTLALKCYNKIISGLWESFALLFSLLFFIPSERIQKKKKLFIDLLKMKKSQKNKPDF